jgi:hypothetical protein
MDVTSNFERAKKLTEDWPSWKREYQLTKNSEAKLPAPPTDHAGTQEHISGAVVRTPEVIIAAGPGSAAPDH